jgi:DNA-binding MarR family transcriptional regulator
MVGQRFGGAPGASDGIAAARVKALRRRGRAVCHPNCSSLVISPKARRSVRSSPAERLPNALAFLRLLWAIDHGLRSVSRRMQSELGLTGPQRLVLRMVSKFPQLMPSELAELLHLDRGTLTGILERLSAQQLLTRTANERDGRSVLVSLTARGRMLDREVPGTVEACIGRALASLPAAKVEAAKQVLEAVARELAGLDGAEGVRRA